MTRVLIDTDPGLDDAIAILITLARCDVAGITTVAGNLGLDVTTANAGRLLALTGRGDVPLHSGAARPLQRGARDEARIHGADGLGGTILPPPLPAQSSDAGGFLSGLVANSAPGSLCLHCLGPLTNLACLTAETRTRLGPVIAMGGALEVRGNVGPRSEFNLAHDPEAAAEVLASGLELTLIPLDTTRQVRADAAYLDRLAAGPPTARAASDLIRAYFDENGSESRPLHDPLVPLFHLYPELFTVEHASLQVDLDDDPGALIPGPHPVKVASAPQVDALLDALALSLGA